MRIWKEKKLEDFLHPEVGEFDAETVDFLFCDDAPPLPFKEAAGEVGGFGV